MITLDKSTKDALIEEARKLTRKKFPSLPENCTGGCLAESVTLLHLIRSYNRLINPLFQAGSMSWPRIDLSKDEDDGKIATHFSYHCDLDSLQSQILLAQNVLPEMHCWLAIPAFRNRPGEIIDICTRHFKANFANISKLPWTGPDPPDYLWAPEVPEGVVYRPQPNAMICALDFATQALLERD